jgi:hypothetical protein
MKRLRPISQKHSPPPSQEQSSTVPASVKRLSRERLQTISEQPTPHRPSRLRHLDPPTERVLDIDIETRLIGFYQAGKFKPQGSEPIAIACSWYGENAVHSVILGEASHDACTALLTWFREFYEQATLVTGHYLTKFDLPILNMSCLEWGMDPLPAMRVQDTKTGLIEFEGFSKSQENLGKMLQTRAPKYHMSDADWRREGRLTLGGQKRGRKRVEADVRQHKELRLKMIERGMIGKPVMWDPKRKF